jgi:hypothetical protein
MRDGDKGAFAVMDSAENGAFPQVCSRFSRAQGHFQIFSFFERRRDFGFGPEKNEAIEIFDNREKPVDKTFPFKSEKSPSLDRRGVQLPVFHNAPSIRVPAKETNGKNFAGKAAGKRIEKIPAAGKNELSYTGVQKWPEIIHLKAKVGREWAESVSQSA